MFNGKYIVGEWRVDATTNTLTRGSDKEIVLPPRLIDMLTFFAKHPKEVISREELVSSLWNRSAVTDQAVTQTIFELRKNLRDGRAAGKAPEYIQTVPKRGYRLVADVEWLMMGESAGLAAFEESVQPAPPSEAQEVLPREESVMRKEVPEEESGTSKLVNLVKNFWLDPDMLGFKKTPY